MRTGHSDQGHAVSPEHHRDIEAEVQNDGQPHPAKGPVIEWGLLHGLLLDGIDIHCQDCRQRKNNRVLISRVCAVAGPEHNHELRDQREHKGNKGRLVFSLDTANKERKDDPGVHGRHHQ